MDLELQRCGKLTVHDGHDTHDHLIAKGGGLEMSYNPGNAPRCSVVDFLMQRDPIDCTGHAILFLLILCDIEIDTEHLLLETRFPESR
jgi:hypothetical protein